MLKKNKFKLSVIVPTYNEVKNQLLLDSISQIQQDPECEIIIVDKKSSDGTAEKFEKQGLKVISTEENTRAGRINLGFKSCSGEYILIHHPRNFVGSQCLDTLKRALRPGIWGGFTHRFEQKNHPLLKFTSWYSNKVRFDSTGIIYLDHCIFFDRNLVGVDVMPKVDIFEDTLLSQKLKKRSHPVRLSCETITSAIRFEKNGVYKQALMNQGLKLAFHLGVDKKRMNRLYENKLKLNSVYPEKKSE